MNTLLLEAVDSLINEDEDKAAQCIKQALIQKMQTKMGLTEASDCIEQLKTLLNDSGKKKAFLNVVTEIFNSSLQGLLEEYWDSIQDYDEEDIEEIYNSLVDETCWDDSFDELAYNVITNAEQSDLYDVEIPSDFKECLSQMKPDDLQNIIDEYKKDIKSLYSKSETAKFYKKVTDEFASSQE